MPISPAGTSTLGLHNGEINMGSEAQAALVGSYSAVELDAEAAVYINLARIVYPSNAEFYNALRLSESLKKTHLLIFGVLCNHSFKGLEHFFNSLKKFGLVMIALFHLI